MNAAIRRLGQMAHLLAWPALWIYLRIGARTRVLVIADEQILLVEGFIDDGRLGLPGGGLHRRERPAVGAAREVTEETGVIVAPALLQPIGSEQQNAKGLSFYCHFFSAQLEQSQSIRRQRREIAQVCWLPISDLASTPHKREVDRALELLAKR